MSQRAHIASVGLTQGQVGKVEVREHRNASDDPATARAAKSTSVKDQSAGIMMP